LVRAPEEAVSEAAKVLDERVARLITDALRRVTYGEVTLVVHNGSVVEVSSTERTRLQQQK
jgi:hypothetical protein